MLGSGLGRAPSALAGWMAARRRSHQSWGATRGRSAAAGCCRVPPAAAGGGGVGPHAAGLAPHSAHCNFTVQLVVHAARPRARASPLQAAIVQSGRSAGPSHVELEAAPLLAA